MVRVGTRDAGAREADFDAYVRARQESLTRFAYLVTADLEASKDVVQIALTKAARSNDHLGAERTGPPVRSEPKHCFGAEGPGRGGNALTTKRCGGSVVMSVRSF